MSEPKIHDQLIAFDEDHTDSAAGPQLVIKRSQEIPDEHIAELKRDKIQTGSDRIGDFFRVASIPVAILEKWDREGFVLEHVLQSGTKGVQQVLNRLKAEHMDAFITTNKRI